MINGIRIKICGLTSLADAEVAAKIGADYLGFILWPKSPRCVPLETARAIAAKLTFQKKVAVMVEPSADELQAAMAAGFDYAQIHFKHTTPLASIEEWSHITGASRLWLAPKLPPALDMPAGWLPLAGAFLLDTFRADSASFGGTGATGDWAKFARHRMTHPQQTWILAGGLNPDNIADAVAQTGARFVDVNSGVESAPGVKDPAKLNALSRALQPR